MTWVLSGLLLCLVAWLLLVRDEAFVVRITQFDPETKQQLSNRVCLMGGLKESFGNVFE